MQSTTPMKTALKTVAAFFMFGLLLTNFQFGLVQQQDGVLQLQATSTEAQAGSSRWFYRPEYELCVNLDNLDITVTNYCSFTLLPTTCDPNECEGVTYDP